MNGFIKNGGNKVGPEKRSSNASIKIISPSNSIENNESILIPIESGDKDESIKDNVSRKSPEISWTNLSCKLKPVQSWNIFKTKSKKEKVILKSLFGTIKESTLVGILGPSGSGKSTLLECLLGRNCSKRLITGLINYENVDKSSVCFISQQDYLYDQLTIEESVSFAASVKCSSDYSLSRLRRVSKNDGTSDKEKRKQQVDNILDNLWLRKCSKVKVSNCSGGQKKRLSIACELVSNPGFLFLDEPTSGLDSSTCFQCIQLLKKLIVDPSNSSSSASYQRNGSLASVDNVIKIRDEASDKKKNTLSILLTIHQPSARVLSSFDQIYVLSKDGDNLYFGPPSLLIQFLSSVNISCPKFHNPADFLIEIASGEHGSEYLRNCINKRNEDNANITINDPKYNQLINLTKLRKINRKDKKKMANILSLYRLKIVLGRNLKVVIREPLLTSLRFIVHIFVGFVVSYLYGSNVGTSNGCNWNNNFGQAEAINRNNLMATNENMTLILFTLMFLTFTSMMPTLLIFPRELSIFLKEQSNGWYKVSTYYLSVCLIDFPFQIILPIFFVGIIYPLTNQIYAFSRFLLFSLICSLTSLVSQSVGMLIATIFATSLNAVVFLAPVSSIPPFLFSGFFVRIQNMPFELKPFTYFSYVKYSFESLVLIIYGLDRCPSQRSLNLESGHEDGDHRDKIFVGPLKSYSSHNYVHSNDVSVSNMTNYNLNNDVIDIPIEESDGTIYKSAQYYGWKKEYYSYVLQEFDLDDGSEGEIMLIKNIIILFCVFIGLRLITLLLLIRKTRN